LDAVSQNHTEFAARLARIEKNISSARQLLFVGVDEVYSMPRRDRKPRVSRGRALLGRLLSPLGYVAALAVGAVAHGVGQVLRFHVQGLADLNANPDVDMMVQTVLGLAIALVAGFALGMKSKIATTLKAVGVLCGVLFFHNAVHMWPQRFVALTSEEWVGQIVSHTTEFSVMWRGATVPF
jgi:hypothetical protein